MPHNFFSSSFNTWILLKIIILIKNDKLAIIKPSIEDVCNEILKIEPKEFHSIDKQIISFKNQILINPPVQHKKSQKMGI